MHTLTVYDIILPRDLRSAYVMLLYVMCVCARTHTHVYFYIVRLCGYKRGGSLHWGNSEWAKPPQKAWFLVDAGRTAPRMAGHACRCCCDNGCTSVRAMKRCRRSQPCWVPFRRRAASASGVSVCVPVRSLSLS